MKKLFLALMLTLPVLASASNDLSTQLIKTLLNNADKIVLEGANEGETIVSILSSELVGNAFVEEGKEAKIVSVSSSCQGVIIYEQKCELTITSADYDKVKEGLVGPKLESSITLKFKTKRVRSLSGQNRSRTMKNFKVEVIRAG